MDLIVKDSFMNCLYTGFSVSNCIFTHSVIFTLLMSSIKFDIYFFALFSFQGTNGGPGKTRTSDLTLIRRAL